MPSLGGGCERSYALNFIGTDYFAGDVAAMAGVTDEALDRVEVSE